MATMPLKSAVTKSASTLPLLVLLMFQMVQNNLESPQNKVLMERKLYLRVPWSTEAKYEYGNSCAKTCRNGKYARTQMISVGQCSK